MHHELISNRWQSADGTGAWRQAAHPICTCGTIQCLPMRPWEYLPVLRLRLCACAVVVHGSSVSREILALRLPCSASLLDALEALCTLSTVASGPADFRICHRLVRGRTTGIL